MQGPFIYTEFVLYLVSHLGVISHKMAIHIHILVCLVSQGFYYAWCTHLGFIADAGAVHMHRVSVMPGVTVGCYN